MTYVVNSILLVLISMSIPAMAKEVSATKIKILFGSCLHQDKPQPIWQPMNQEQADLFVLLGDNIYGDTQNMSELEGKYAKQWATAGMQTMLANTTTIGIWDDHDFGENDAGAEYPQKEASRQILLDYFKVPKNSIRRTRADGIYTSHMLTQDEIRVQIILPDLRWNRGPLNSVSKLEYISNKAPNNLGPYLPHSDPKNTLLGDAQWQWLEQQLQQPADVRIFASSIQLLPEFSGWESWANLPHERQRFLGLLDKYQIDNLIIVSGDTHWSELSQISRQNGKALWEMTTSGLTEEWKAVSPNTHRQGQSYSKANYGVIELNNKQLSMSIKDVTGKKVMTKTLSLDKG
ncbi:alkaline phosphatase D family protein [Paraglaciecola arctica]|uniref:alkaline phosphatase D family protein n=1 Tax=Paraglaciecola arctica TaxID=1128911 RepID=UPI001C06B2B4|nr:alkaline phosphatase D family protein [Paraglaciecola arctica]MBU3004024.1 alkaline phosphatase family protein [Paraglaciecola arctica]